MIPLAPEPAPEPPEPPDDDEDDEDWEADEEPEFEPELDDDGAAVADEEPLNKTVWNEEPDNELSGDDETALWV